jgi:hypothetical protein
LSLLSSLPTTSRASIAKQVRKSRQQAGGIFSKQDGRLLRTGGTGIVSYKKAVLVLLNRSEDHHWEQFKPISWGALALFPTKSSDSASEQVRGPPL